MHTLRMHTCILIDMHLQLIFKWQWNNQLKCQPTKVQLFLLTILMYVINMQINQVYWIILHVFFHLFDISNNLSNHWMFLSSILLQFIKVSVNWRDIDRQSKSELFPNRSPPEIYELCKREWLLLSLQFKFLSLCPPSIDDGRKKNSTHLYPLLIYEQVFLPCWHLLQINITA